MWKLLSPDFASILFSLFLWLPSTVPSSQSSQSSSQVALHVALELASAAFTSSRYCPSPVLGPLWSHRQVIFLIGPSLFGACFLIVGLSIFVHAPRCSYSMVACLRPQLLLSTLGIEKVCAVHTVLIVGHPNVEIVLGDSCIIKNFQKLPKLVEHRSAD